MEKVYIKKIDKEIEIDIWSEVNKVVSQVVGKYMIDNNLGTSIIKNTINEDGFAIDFKTEKNISENSLPLIEGKIKKQLTKDVSVDSDLPTSMIKGLKLRGVSGLTVNDSENANRIFGFATLTKDDFESKLNEIEEREQRDHRKIGKELELFYFNDLAGKGMPIWLENGFLLKKQIKDYIYEQERKYGSSIIETPIIGASELYKISGHLSHYKNTMFPLMENEEGEEFVLRPMSCPHHILVYKRKPRSYRELPVRLSEDVKMFRYEHSGALIGLERVRGMELTDSHIFLKEEQLKNELNKSLNLIIETLAKFEIEIDYIELALHDPEDREKYHGNPEMWEKAETTLRDFLKSNDVKFVEMKGEAAFYGPKIDIQIKTALGHNITVSTIQIDFYLPKKFNLEYIDSDQSKKTPIMIHRGHIGTYERFISVLLEQTKGDLPMWLAPRQAVIIPINNNAHLEYAKEVYDKLFENKIRVSLNDSDERLSNKIRISQQAKIKTQIIIGDEEVKNRTISYRFYGKEETLTLPLKKMLDIYK